MKDSESTSVYARMDLRRLWPVVSTKLYPEAIKKIQSTLEDIKAIKTGSEEHGELMALIEQVERKLEHHNAEAGDIIAQRLQTVPYGTTTFPADYFASACERHAVSSAEIKSTWAAINLTARRWFSRSKNTAQEKLALARLTALEQDIMYLLFMEHEYLCPQILKNIS